MTSFCFLRIGDPQLTHRSAHRGDWHNDGPAWRRTRDMLQTEISVRERGKYLRQRAVLHVPTELLPCFVKHGEHAIALVTFPFEVYSQVRFADCLLYLTLDTLYTYYRIYLKLDFSDVMSSLGKDSDFLPVTWTLSFLLMAFYRICYWGLPSNKKLKKVLLVLHWHVYNLGAS